MLLGIRSVSDYPPDELLTRLDDLVSRLSADADAEAGDDADADIGATCLYAVYDPVSRRCSLARAGHPLPGLVTPDGTASFLDLPAGPPLGLGGLPSRGAGDVRPGDAKLVCYGADGQAGVPDDAAPPLTREAGRADKVDLRTCWPRSWPRRLAAARWRSARP